jgi:hypothetical protein
LEYVVSSESDAAAYPAVDQVSRAVELAFRDALRSSPLHDIQLTLRYVPIVMPTGLRERYPPRSKARVKQRILDCSPQLSYEPFVGDSFRSQLEAYVQGLRTASLLMPMFGFSPADIREFESLLSKVVVICGG